MQAKVIKLKVITDIPGLRAIAEVEIFGLTLRGLKLIEHNGSFTLQPAARRLKSAWQNVYDIKGSLKDTILKAVLSAYLLTQKPPSLYYRNGG